MTLICISSDVIVAQTIHQYFPYVVYEEFLIIYKKSVKPLVINAQLQLRTINRIKKDIFDSVMEFEKLHYLTLSERGSTKFRRHNM